MIFGLKGVLFIFLNKPPLLAGAQTALSIAENISLNEVILLMYLGIYTWF